MRSFDVLVVGAGPAGMAAAWAASSPSRRVGVIDDNPGAGGQIWRGERSSHWFTRFSTCGAELLNGKAHPHGARFRRGSEGKLGQDEVAREDDQDAPQPAGVAEEGHHRAHLPAAAMSMSGERSAS